MNKTIFKTNFDTKGKILTGGLILVLAYALGSLLYNAIIREEQFKELLVAFISIGIFVGAGLWFAYRYAPTHYELTNQNLLIHYPAGYKAIAYSNITEIIIPEKSIFKFPNTLRTFGNGGLFGYYGKYYNRKYGSLWVYARNNKNRTIIKTNYKAQYIISPDDPKMIEYLNSRLPH